MGFFDRTYIVNLASRTDRRHAIEAELRHAGIAATDGWVRFFAALRPSDAQGFPSIGAFGCFQSHHALLRQAVADGVEHVLVLEDDLMFLPNMTARWPEIEAALHRHPWGLAYFGFDEADVAGEAAANGHAERPLERCSRPMQKAHFYAVHGSMLKPLTEFLDLVLSRPEGHPLGGPMHFDGALSMFRAQHPECLTVRSAVPLGVQRPSRSDIAPNRWFDRIAGLGVMVGALRGLKGRLRRRRAQPPSL